MDTDIPTAYAAPVLLPIPTPGDDKKESSESAPPLVPCFPGVATSPVGGLVLPEPPSPSSDIITPDQIAQLKEQGFTEGLARSLASSVSAFPLRIWVVDNSGSMTAVDGHRFVHTSKKDDVQVVTCTRWKEIQETVEYHAQIAALLGAPTIFRLLNDPGRRVGPAQFGVADKGDAFIDEDVQLAMTVMTNAEPGGATPLARHVREIREQISALAPTLTERGQKVAVVLATDGLPTDDRGVCNEYYKSDFLEALRGLEGLPVWVVVRLCTDDELIVDYYNDLDGQLELSVEVLDDFAGEADEVHDHNRWLNYALPLHRCREMGFHHRIMDLLDERKLTAGEMAEFCMLLFGEGRFDGAPDPEVDLSGFLKIVKSALGEEEAQYNAVKSRVLPWVDVKKMKKVYRRKRRHRWVGWGS